MTIAGLTHTDCNPQRVQELEVLSQAGEHVGVEESSTGHAEGLQAALACRTKEL